MSEKFLRLSLELPERARQTDRHRDRKTDGEKGREGADLLKVTLPPPRVQNREVHAAEVEGGKGSFSGRWKEEEEEENVWRGANHRGMERGKQR